MKNIFNNIDQNLKKEIEFYLENLSKKLGRIDFLDSYDISNSFIKDISSLLKGGSFTFDYGLVFNLPVPEESNATLVDIEQFIKLLDFILQKTNFKNLIKDYVLIHNYVLWSDPEEKNPSLRREAGTLIFIILFNKPQKLTESFNYYDFYWLLDEKKYFSSFILFLEHISMFLKLWYNVRNVTIDGNRYNNLFDFLEVDKDGKTLNILDEVYENMREQMKIQNINFVNIFLNIENYKKNEEVNFNYRNVSGMGRMFILSCFKIFKNEKVNEFNINNLNFETSSDFLISESLKEYKNKNFKLNWMSYLNTIYCLDYINVITSKFKGLIGFGIYNKDFKFNYDYVFNFLSKNNEKEEVFNNILVMITPKIFNDLVKKNSNFLGEFKKMFNIISDCNTYWKNGILIYPFIMFYDKRNNFIGIHIYRFSEWVPDCINLGECQKVGFFYSDLYGLLEIKKLRKFFMHPIGLASNKCTEDEFKEFIKENFFIDDITSHNNSLI